MFFAHVVDAGAAGLEDAQTEQAQERDQGEVARFGGLPGGGDQCFELQVAQAEGRRFGRNGGTADVVGWGAFEDGIDDADPVEAALLSESLLQRGLAAASVAP